MSCFLTFGNKKIRLLKIGLHNLEEKYLIVIFVIKMAKCKFEKKKSWFLGLLVELEIWPKLH